MKINWQTLSQEIVKKLRGRSPQMALSRRLGFTTNVVYRWEAGLRKAKVSDLVAILTIRRPQAIQSFWQFAGFQDVPPSDQIGWNYASWLNSLRGNRSVEDIATGIDISGSILRRMFRGDADPNLGRLLMVVQGLTGRIVDFVELMVDPSELKSIRSAWRSVVAQRKTAEEQFNAQSVIAALEIDDYLSLETHSDQWIAQTLGLPLDEVEHTIASLRTGGAIKLRAGKYRVERNRYVNTQHDVDVTRRLGAHWAQTGLALPTSHCARGHLVFSCSPEALQKIYEIYARAHHEAVAAFQDGHGGDPSRVVCISTQFAFLDGQPKP